VKRADSLLAPLIKRLKIEDGVRLGHIKEEWPDIFEKPISLHMSPASLKEGELLINVDSPVWLQQLSFYKETIIKKLHGFGVNTIRFRIGRVLLQTKQDKTISETKPLTENDHYYIKETVSSIPDQELKDRIKRAIEKSIMFKR